MSEEFDDKYHEVWDAQRREIPTIALVVVFGTVAALPVLALAYYLFDRLS